MKRCLKGPDRNAGICTMWGKPLAAGRLDENLRGEDQAGTKFLDSGYTRLTVSLLERTNGLVDQMKFLISDDDRSETKKKTVEQI